jgi:hypothetical protein
MKRSLLTALAVMMIVTFAYPVCAQYSTEKVRYSHRANDKISLESHTPFAGLWTCAVNSTTCGGTVTATTSTSALAAGDHVLLYASDSKWHSYEVVSVTDDDNWVRKESIDSRTVDSLLAVTASVMYEVNTGASTSTSTAMSDGAGHRLAFKLQGNATTPTAFLSVDDDGNTTAGGTLAVTGATTLTGGVTGGLTVNTGDITLTADATGGNAGARSQVIGMPALALISLGTMANGTTETSSYIDDTPTGEWAGEGTSVTVTADTTYYRYGAKSLKIAFGTAATTSAAVTVTCAADDMTNNESIGFWIYSDTTLSSGDFEIVLDDDDASPDWAGDVTTVTANSWQWVELDISGCDGGGTDCDAVSSIDFGMTTQGATNLGAVNIYIDVMYKWDAADEEGLGHNLVTDGVLSVLTVATAAGSANTQALLTEGTDYLVNYQSGNDVLVPITDQSAKSGMALIAYQ